MITKILDPITSTLVSVSLKNENEEEKNLGEILKSIINRVKEKLISKDNNSLKQTTWPLSLLISSYICDQLLAREEADLIQLNPVLRETIMICVIAGMYISRYMAKENLKISTSSEQLQQNVADKLHRQITMQSVISQVKSLGYSTPDILSTLLAQEIIFEEDLDVFKYDDEEKREIVNHGKEIMEKISSNKLEN